MKPGQRTFEGNQSGWPIELRSDSESESVHAGWMLVAMGRRFALGVRVAPQTTRFLHCKVKANSDRTAAGTLVTRVRVGPGLSLGNTCPAGCPVCVGKMAHFVLKCNKEDYLSVCVCVSERECVLRVYTLLLCVCA